MDYDDLHQFIATGILLRAIPGSRLKFRRLSILTQVEQLHTLPLFTPGTFSENHLLTSNISNFMVAMK
jgi:hypothetical protein